MKINTSPRHHEQRRESLGNVWSGVVALGLLALFTVALVASESAHDERRTDSVTIITAGQ